MYEVYRIVGLQYLNTVQLLIGLTSLKFSEAISLRAALSCAGCTVAHLCKIKQTL